MEALLATFKMGDCYHTECGASTRYTITLQQERTLQETLADHRFSLFSNRPFPKRFKHGRFMGFSLISQKSFQANLLHYYSSNSIQHTNTK